MTIGLLQMTYHLLIQETNNAYKKATTSNEEKSARDYFWKYNTLPDKVLSIGLTQRHMKVA